MDIKKYISGFAFSSIVAIFATVSAQQFFYHYKDGDIIKSEDVSNIDSVAISDNTIRHYKSGNLLYELSASEVDSIAFEPIICIEKTELELKNTMDSEWLGFTSVPKGSVRASDVIWTSSNPAVAKVSDGYVSPINEGECVISGRYGSRMVSCAVKVTHALTVGGREFVDLGLASGTLWATYNVGSANTEARGGYYAWGEVSEKNSYYSNSEWWGYTMDELYSKGVINDVADSLTENLTGNLRPHYDAAYSNWNSDWRMPTLSEFNELTELESHWTEKNGVYGREFIGKNGNTLFLPAYGWKREKFEGGDLNEDQVTGMYWTSTFYKTNGSYLLTFKKDTISMKPAQVGFGTQIRPVVDMSSEKFILVEKRLVLNLTDQPFTLGFVSLPSGTILVDDVEWTTSDVDVASVSKGVVSPVGIGECTIYAKYGNRTLSCFVEVIGEPEPEDPVKPEYVDLGLTSGTLWATSNIGSVHTNGIGDMFAWGEVTPNVSTSRWCNVSDLIDAGAVNGQGNLGAMYDAATTLWGVNWKMPTYNQICELLNECDVENIITPEGVAGIKVSSRTNDNSIILPISNPNSTCYWSSSYVSFSNANVILLNSTSNKVDYKTRSSLCCIRPVYTTEYDTIITIGFKDTTVRLSDISLSLDFKSNQEGVVASDVKWSSTAENVATVKDGIVTLSHVGECFIKGEYRNQVVCCKIKVKNGEANGHEYLDLGLPSGTLWALENIGTTDSKESGDYFSWGETASKGRFKTSNYSFMNKSKEDLQTMGVIDRNGNLTVEYDAASVLWGEAWRLPTQSEFEELKTNSSSMLINSVLNFEFPENKNLTLPIGGYLIDTIIQSKETGYIWTSSISSNNKNFAVCCSYYAVNNKSYYNCGSMSSYNGLNIRPVRVTESVKKEDFEIKPELTINILSGKSSIGFVCDRDVHVSQIKWTSSDKNVASVEQGYVTACGIGNCVITATYKDKSVTCKLTVADLDYVDLGLPSGTLWASCNLGAASPSEIGDLYRWGETEVADNIVRDSYNESYMMLMEKGVIDENYTLTPSHDAVTSKNENWRMPTEKEAAELVLLRSEWVTINGVKGRKIYGYNGNSIFLPTIYDDFTTMCRYWLSSMPYSEYSIAYSLQVNPSELAEAQSYKKNTAAIRPVRKKSSAETAICLYRKSLTMMKSSEPTSLGLISRPDNTVSASDVKWITSDPSVATVENGMVSPVGEGNCVITASYENSTAKCDVRIINDINTDYEYVDLGLSSGTLWATRNIGASSEEDKGSYFSFGETEPKDSFYYSSSFMNGMSNKELERIGMLDTAGNLLPTDDAASMNCGLDWRMPTTKEIDELSKLTSQKTVVNGVYGILYTGKNGKKLFIPNAGYKMEKGIKDSTEVHIWSSSISYSENNSYGTYVKLGELLGYQYNRGYGMPVRPVRKNKIIARFVRNIMGLTTKGGPDTLFLKVVATGEIASSGIVWTSSDKSVATVNNGVVSPVGVGKCVVTATYMGSELTCDVYVQETKAAMGNEYIDLGLPSKNLWAVWNIGAKSKEQIGSYFAWGETSSKPQANYNKKDYKWSGMEDDSLKALSVIDENDNLIWNHDAATEQWGSMWKMPTKEDFQELIDNCYVSNVTINGVYGYKFISKINGMTLFFPAGGCMSSTSPLGTSVAYYWTSSYYNDSDSYNLHIYIISYDWISATVYTEYRHYGLPVRAIYKP